MLTTMENYLRFARRGLGKWALNPTCQKVTKVATWGGSGFFLSAAGLRGSFQPLALGLVCALTGWRSAVAALGAAVGYRLFWGSAGAEGALWVGLAWVLSLVGGRLGLPGAFPALYWALTALITAASELVFLFFRPGGGFALFAARVLLAPVAAWFFHRAITHRDSLTDWTLGGLGVLALARLGPLGYGAAGLMSIWGAFPAAALAGLGLDLARVTALPMAVVISSAWFGRMIPFRDRWMRCFLPGAAALVVMGLCGVWDLRPLPGLVLGGALGYLLPPRPDGARRHGELGVAQVRLEMAAGVLAQTQRLLLEVPEQEIDEKALLNRAINRGCGTCAIRETCPDRARLGQEALLEPLSFGCPHPWAIQGELLRARDRLRDLQADRQRRQEYRRALIQQYQFLAVYLQKLSDQLPRRGRQQESWYRLEVSARCRSRETACGDRCMAFPGAGCRYYVLLCDGMGTGLGAAQEGKSAGELLRQMLTAGFPPEHAFRSVNSLLLLRGQAGAVTLDLAELRLDSGRVSLYKWGAAPSYLLRAKGAEKIGTATPPPGLALTNARESVDRLSLRRGEVLILVSDGADIGEVLRRGTAAPLPPGELAEWLLKECGNTGEDDATVAVMRLQPRRLST